MNTEQAHRDRHSAVEIPIDLPGAITPLLRLADEFRARAETALEGHGLSWAKYELLKALSDSGPSTYAQLAHHLQRHRTSIAQTARATERRGLVARNANPEKPQQLVIEVTELGRAVVRRADRALTSNSVRAVLGEHEKLIDVRSAVEHLLRLNNTLARVHARNR